MNSLQYSWWHTSRDVAMKWQCAPFDGCLVGIPLPVRIWDDSDLSARIVNPFSASEKYPLELRFLRVSVEIVEGLDGLDVAAILPSTVLCRNHTRVS